MKRPVWLSITEFRRLQAKYLQPGPSGEMQMRCVSHHPEGHVWLNSSNGVFDHIVPRVNGGADVSDNLQPMCLSCNSQKNRFADGNWSRRLYFDAPLNTEALRASQNDFCYAKIMEFSEEFARPYSMINGNLLCLFQVVGAGKTLEAIS
ncbi:MAG: HNH endonuclease signature motif containing protein [Verrucomicrobiales bacterium]|nr:HNH endonuclease signature motif containing protein [Verrucomicrobiales bacterium]